LALVEQNAHLPLGDNVGADVEHDRVAVGRSAEAKRVGADARLRAARRRDAAAEAVIVDGGNECHVATRRCFRIFAEPADVAALPERAGGEAERLGTRDQAIEQAMRLHLAETPAAIDDEDCRRLFDDVERRAGLEPAVLDRVGVLDDADHAVRVVPARIREHQALGGKQRITWEDARSISLPCWNAMNSSTTHARRPESIFKS
jgi:hypothetical protein